jgi:hypothetical protein
MAGTGKSTISRTLAQLFADKRNLGASFFFKKGEADQGSLAKFFTTIAADLAVREPSTASHIKDVLDSDPSIFTKNTREQFDKFFLQPLSKIAADTRIDGPAVIIIDALDECERDDDIKLLLHLFSCANNLQYKRLKIFITSRPELSLRLGFKAIKGTYQEVSLHEMPNPVVERDIYAFLEHELARIRIEYNALVEDDRHFATDWPSPSDVQSLAKMSVPLFIFAATVCRFIAERKLRNPAKQLVKVLRHQTTSHRSTLAEMYLLVLKQQIAGLDQEEETEVLQEFRDIVGPIIILASPLSTSALAQILSISRRTIDDGLNPLHSVLSVPRSAGAPVRLLHLSFRDFLVDSKKREMNPFWIDKRQTHETVAANCLRIMDCLRRDICEIKAPGTPRLAFGPQKISARLPSEIQYASLYWVYHTQRAEIHISDGDTVHGFLICHFLHWMEALRLMGRASESLRLIRMLQSLLKVGSQSRYRGYSVLNMISSRKIARSSRQELCRRLPCLTDVLEGYLPGDDDGVLGLAISTELSPFVVQETCFLSLALSELFNVLSTEYRGAS